MQEPQAKITDTGEIERNARRRKTTVTVANTGDRPVLVGSHFHFFEVNEELRFEREKTRGVRLKVIFGTLADTELLIVHYRKMFATPRRRSWSNGDYICFSGCGSRCIAENYGLKIEVDPETYKVFADGEFLTCKPAKVLPIAQRYFFF